MAKSKFYAVKIGRNKGIFYTWDECKAQVNGFPGARYKSFQSLEEANEFLGLEGNLNNEVKINIENLKKEKTFKTFSSDSVNAIRSKAKVKVYTEYVDYNTLKEEYDFIAFVDGSYDKNTKTYGSGIVVLDLENNDSKCYAHAGFDKWDQWNIVGELEATKKAIQIAKEEYKSKNVAIYHDLKNISLWASGQWQAKNDYTKDYVKTIEEFSKEINICFVKVKAHSTESKFNDLADETAKRAIIEYNK